MLLLIATTSTTSHLTSSWSPLASSSASAAAISSASIISTVLLMIVVMLTTIKNLASGLHLLRDCSPLWPQRSQRFQRLGMLVASLVPSSLVAEHHSRSRNMRILMRLIKPRVGDPSTNRPCLMFQLSGVHYNKYIKSRSPEPQTLRAPDKPWDA